MKGRHSRGLGSFFVYAFNAVCRRRSENPRFFIHTPEAILFYGCDRVRPDLDDQWGNRDPRDGVPNRERYSCA